jgi:cell division protein FtsQ
MSDAVFTGLEDFDLPNERQTGRKDSKTQDKRISILKVLVLILCVLLLFEAILYMLVIPCLAPAKVQFSGLTTLSSDEMMGMLNTMNAKTWMQFDTGKAVSLISTIPGVESVSVDKRFPDRVIVQVKERAPVAQTIVTLDNRSTPVQIDENGVLFPSTASAAITDTTVPLVTGLPVDRVPNGMRIPEKYRTLMEQIATIRSLPQKYFAAISEIQVVPKEYGNYELILYPIHSRVRVLTDRSLNEDALKYMMVVLDVVNSIEPDVSEIDLRYGSVSYRKR